MLDEHDPDTAPVYSTFGADPDLGDLVDMFVEEMPGRIANLLKLIDEHDWTALGRTAHQLKGSSGSYGFDRLTTSASLLERAIKESQPEQQIRRAVDELVGMCRRARSGAPANLTAGRVGAQ